MYNKNYTNYNKKPYNPKAVVKNFTDLEVYQKALETSVFVANEIIKALKYRSIEILNQESAKTKKQEIKKLEIKKISDWPSSETYLQDLIIKNMLPCAMSIPHLIAESHSKRFGESTECLRILDEVMLKCNKMVVYLEQTRDICETGIETERFKEQIDKYFYIRRKVLNLQRVWRKYIVEAQNSNVKI